MFTVQVKYKDGEVERTNFEEYKEAVVHANEEAEWENTRSASVINSAGHRLLKVRGAYYNFK